MSRAALILGLLTGCLDPHTPPMDAERDAPPDARETEVPAPDPLRVTGLRCVDPRGNPCPLDGAPWSARFELDATTPLDAEGTFLFILRAESTSLEDFERDLARAPLRRSHLDDAVPVDVERTTTGARVVPEAALDPGDYFVGVAAWARAFAADDSSDEPTLGAPQVYLVSVLESGGAVLSDTWPPDAAADVPLDTRRFVLRFDAPVLGIDAITLRSDRGRLTTRAALHGCAEFGWTEGVCVALHWEGRLRPRSDYIVELGPGVTDHVGAAVDGSVSFRTGDSLSAPPEFLPTVCAIDEQDTPVGCLHLDDEGALLRTRFDAPAIASIHGADRTQRTLAPRGEASLELGLPAGSTLNLSVTLESLGGALRTYSLPVETPASMPTLTISEVCANPVGREPAQEYVELFNFGSAPVLLTGMAIADRGDREGDVFPPSPSLPPGARALVVADAYDDDDPSDPRAPPGTTLIRIGTSIASGGLSNGGEPLTLRDALGRRIASVPATAYASGRCWARRDAGRRSPTHEGACTPGRP